jgi:hypothetical protein
MILLYHIMVSVYDNAIVTLHYYSIVSLQVAAQRYVLLGAAEQPLTSMDDVADVLKRGTYVLL